MTERPVSNVIRGTIFVRDLERSKAFYQALGFIETYIEIELEHPSATSIIGFAEHYPFRVAILKPPGPNFGMVGLFELDPRQKAESLPVAEGPARIGEVALVFYVADMMGTLTKLRASGASWSPEPEAFRMEHRSQLEVCLRDPDGVLLNLVETDPAEQERERPELDYVEKSDG